MASISSLGEASIAIFSSIIFILCFHLFKKPHNKGFLRNWPVLGMLPGLLMEFHRIYDFSVENLEASNLTFAFKGPWYFGMDMLFTVDQENIRHIMNSHSSNYTKGPDFKEVFDVLGDGILTADSKLWKSLRKASKAMVDHQRFQKLSMSTTRRKLNDGLVPLFNKIAEEETVVDLQDLFGRFMFDTTLMTVSGCDDPRSLSIDMSEVDEFAKALNNIGEGIMYRLVNPKFLWKLQRRIGFGQEKKLSKADATLNQISRCNQVRALEPERNDDKFLRDTMLAFILAGRDTNASALTWFFWLLSENPQVVANIRQEINTNLPRITTGGGGPERPSYDVSMEFLNKLVYLHGSLYEAMRLYPPVPFERLSPVKQDKLPSGHEVDPSMKVLIFVYALGRMKAIWGDDALKFKPERWVSMTGGLVEVPSSKFFSFNAGPRACLGKKLAMTQMKTVVVEILQNYDVQVVEGQKIEPAPGPILRMKHGLRAAEDMLTSSGYPAGQLGVPCRTARGTLPDSSGHPVGQLGASRRTARVPEPTLLWVPEPTLLRVPEPTLLWVPEPTLLRVPEAFPHEEAS
ncbi:Cytochrome P450 superfamily [Arabidopsis suecica]|uniref:Cytochrome P450 superfamily n=1 Tax=Arabidopsis suecica TaxID=45249 RepID=A0A8T1YR63_ARASU|nr:Cytochrome P450 superfamily [Arabidopsis suecica]